MGMLNEPLGLMTLVPDPDPETVTARRRESNQLLGINRGPSQYELDFYARLGQIPPTD